MNLSFLKIIFNKRLWSSVLIALFILFTFLAVFLYLTPKGGVVRETIAQMLITTQKRNWAWILVGEERKDQLLKEFRESIEKAAKIKEDLKKVQVRPAQKYPPLIEMFVLKEEMFRGTVMIVRNPKSLRVMIPTQPGEGERVSDMVKRTGAIAGINAGGYVSLKDSFTPLGIVISNGRVLYYSYNKEIPIHMVGLTNDGILIAGKYKPSDLLKMGVKEAVTFYPRLIINGDRLIKSGDGGWGRGPRTAIGQRKDGTLILLTIDGRRLESIGATLREVQDIMLDYGAVNAVNLDGGSSSVMVYNNQVISNPSSPQGERKMATGFLVFQNPDSVEVNNVWPDSSFPTVKKLPSGEQVMPE